VLRRGWIKRLEKKARAGHGRFLLATGEVYFYDPQRAAMDLFTHCVHLMCDPEQQDEVPEEPEILVAIRKAQDPVGVLSRFRADNPERGFVDPLVLLQDGPESPEDAP
jgi:hypothetical protein